MPLANIHYLTTPEALSAAVATLRSAPRIAVDLEFDDMRHRYGRNLALVQVFDGQQVYLVDPLPLPNPVQDLRPLWDVFEDPAVEKIFHSCRSDILLLDEVYGVHVRNITDTSVQYQLLGEADNNISLGRLVQQELGLELDKGEQKSNWLKRPLTEAQLEYAANDVIYLFELAERLTARLESLGRSQWSAEESAALEDVRYQRDDRPWMKIAGRYRISHDEMPLFRDLYLLREEVARVIDRPPYMVFANDRLSELVRETPKGLAAWKNARGLHPDLKRTPYIERLTSMSPGEYQPLPDPPAQYPERRYPSRRRLTGAAAARADQREQQLMTLKARLADDYNGYVANLVLSNRLIAEIVEQGASEALRPWQQQLLRETSQRHGLDFEELARPLDMATSRR
ncbi:ribonuclease D [Hymenobacter koreensis]|uniref:HRDC domain-containing protein n=1 Tax=Hymenobacter koreensis TaxID=1084523 RepID=A0ABP8IVV8_9BACT